MGKVFDKTKNENNKNVDTTEGLMSKKKNIKFFFHPEQWSLFAYGLVRRRKFIFIFLSIYDGENGKQRKAPHGPS